MPPDFLLPKRKKKKKKKKIVRKIFLEKNLEKKKSIVNNNNRIIRAWYLQEFHEEHAYLPKKTRIFPVKLLEIRIILYFRYLRGKRNERAISLK